MENKELESLPKLLRQFCAYLQYERQYAPHTLTAYCKDLQQFGGYMDERYGLLVLAEATALGQLRPLHVRGYIASLEAKRSTLNRKLSAIRSFVKYQHRMGVIESVPTLKMKLPKTPRRVPVAVAQDALAEQLEQMRAVADDFESARNWLILELLYGCGLRRQELIDLQWQQIDPAARIMSVWGKGSKERTVPYNTAVDAALSHYRTFLSLEQQAPSTPVLLTSKGGSIYPKLVYRVVQKCIGRRARFVESQPSCFAPFFRYPSAR